MNKKNIKISQIIRYYLLGFLLILGIHSNTIAQSKSKINIVASASMIADMAKNIAGDLADVTMIVPIGGDPHIFEPTPSSARMAADAEIIFKNGLTFEGWLTDLINNSGTAAPIITITEGVDAITSQQYKNATDPHAWMSAQNGIVYAENIKNALAKYWPEYAQLFQDNFEIYKKKLEEMDIYIKEKIATIPNDKKILITSHDAFQYYGRRYNIQLESILGISTDAEVQTSDIRRLTEVIQTTKVPAVFIESTINPKLLERIAKDNNVRIGGKLFADSLGDEDSEAPTYLAMLKHNTDVIVAALLQDRQAVSDDSSNKNNRSKPFWMYLVGGFILVGLIALIIGRRKSI